MIRTSLVFCRCPNQTHEVLTPKAQLGLVLALCLLTAEPSRAEDTPRHRLRYVNFTVLRINPLGLQNQFQLNYRYKLYDSDSILFKTGYAGAGFHNVITPGLVKAGLFVEAEPIAVLRLNARWEYIQYYGVLGHMRSFANIDADYSDTAIDAGEEAGQEEANGGMQVTLSAELRAKVGPVVVRSKLQGIYSHFALPHSNPVWYDPFYDLLTPAKGWTLLNDADVLVMLFDKRLILGVRHNLTHAFYPDKAIGPNGRDTADTPTQRLGPLVAYRIFDDPGSAWNRPTVVLLVNWYLQHPSRTGQDVNQAIPYMAIGFAFDGDLL